MEWNGDVMDGLVLGLIWFGLVWFDVFSSGGSLTLVSQMTCPIQGVRVEKMDVHLTSPLLIQDCTWS